MVPNVIFVELALKLGFGFSDTGFGANRDELIVVLVTFVVLVVLFSTIVLFAFEVKLNPDEVAEILAAGRLVVVEVLAVPFPKLNTGPEVVVFVLNPVDPEDSLTTDFVSPVLFESVDFRDNVLLVLLNDDVALGRSKVTRLGVVDLLSVSLFKIGTMVVVIGDVFTVVVDVKEFKDM